MDLDSRDTGVREEAGSIIHRVTFALDVKTVTAGIASRARRNAEKEDRPVRPTS